MVGWIARPADGSMAIELSTVLRPINMMSWSESIGLERGLQVQGEVLTNLDLAIYVDSKETGKALTGHQRDGDGHSQLFVTGQRTEKGFRLLEAYGRYPTGSKVGNVGISNVP